MNARELRALSDDELSRRMQETRRELFNLRFAAVTGSIESSARLRSTKRDIARILTIQGEREREEAT